MQDEKLRKQIQSPYFKPFSGKILKHLGSSCDYKLRNYRN